MATVTPKIQKARAGLVRRLSQIDGNGKVLSVYVDLDPSEFATPPARESQIHSLTNEAEAMVEKLDQQAKKPLREDVRRVREFLLNNGNDWTTDAQAVAIFASGANDLFEVVKLPEPLPRGVFVDDRPHIQPLREMVDQDKWLVLLVDRRVARIFIGSPLALKEYDETEDDVRGQHDQGGWSQARFARAVEEDVEDHLKKVTDRLMTLHKSMDFDHILVGADEELWPRISNRLHSYVAEDVIGRIDADVQMDDAEELQTKVKSVQAQLEHEREQYLLGALRREVGIDGRAATGLSPVLAALNEARVDTLLIAEGFDATGTECPQCGYLSESAQQCPVDGTRMEQVATIFDRAVDKAEETSAEVFTVREPDGLGEGIPIAAILRF
ncbi:MAG TPA: Vms1/Ankzf1 family peptidyl-tRNA hydrolase [Actinomycetota bacterium]|nr:Vms1/Ankzf1 family peptidyl-tRNA hydrolase [Actinomycetota bacterium]